jgi:hypothetical protein
MQNSDVPFYDEDIIDNFEVEELEDRLENKWVKVCPTDQHYDSQQDKCVADGW